MCRRSGSKLKRTRLLFGNLVRRAAVLALDHGQLVTVAIRKAGAVFVAQAPLPSIVASPVGEVEQLLARGTLCSFAELEDFLDQRTLFRPAIAVDDLVGRLAVAVCLLAIAVALGLGRRLFDGLRLGNRLLARG